MKKGLKSCFILLLLVVFFSMLCIIGVVLKDAFIVKIMKEVGTFFPWLSSYFAGLLIGLCVLLIGLLLITIMLNSKRDRLIIKENGNRTEILKSTLTQLARQACGTIIPSQRAKVKIKIKRKSLIVIKIRIEVSTLANETKIQKTVDEIRAVVHEKLLVALEDIQSSVIVRVKKRDFTSKLSQKRRTRVV